MSDGMVIQNSSLSSNPISDHLNENPMRVAGQMLKQARVDAGLHIAALAVTLKVPVKRLEALEDGNLALLQDMVFVRALASSVCRTLQVDSAPVLERLPKAVLPRLNNDYASINMPIRLQNSVEKLQLFDLIRTPWLMGVLLLVTGAALMYFLPKSSTNSTFDLASALKVLTVTGSNPNVETPAQIDKSTPEKLVPSAVKLMPDAPLSVVPVQTKDPIVTADGLAVTNADASIPGTFTLVTTNVTVPANSIVVFKATGQTWVEVKSINGITILKKLLNAGEIAGASGTLPLTVIVGRADVTQVEVRGKSIDLSTIAKSNVARFEVN
jgi:cytoskeleton protein RodZ